MLELVEMRYKGLERIQKTFKNKADRFQTAVDMNLSRNKMNLPPEDLKAKLKTLNAVLTKVIRQKKHFSDCPIRK